MKPLTRKGVLDYLETKTEAYLRADLMLELNQLIDSGLVDERELTDVTARNFLHYLGLRGSPRAAWVKKANQQGTRKEKELPEKETMAKIIEEMK